VHQKRRFVVCFPLDVPIVHSSMLADTTDGELLMCGGFSLGETVHFESLKFIANCFSNLSLSPKGSDSGAIFMGMTCSGSLSLRAVIENFTNEFYMVSSREESFDLPIYRRHGTVAPPAPIATTPWPKDTPASQTMMMVPLQTLTPWSDTGLPPERWHASREGQRV
jgi:hypothetical protein